eukprot:CAMPEP_0170560146 /NCGR_PEP_ID=MMETSP0211-20121228/47191_1 /TAXON_ID=311385 /ORGANISM="Pseudokeronopsis sp., Strain OXSARD2" /LENGTH=99 /DNA_ID=CAMNT_0010873991 /DNA_START=215 /DNA_END=510 /DNA_ORIENTATION=+
MAYLPVDGPDKAVTLGVLYELILVDIHVPLLISDAQFSVGILLSFEQSSKSIITQSELGLFLRVLTILGLIFLHGPHLGCAIYGACEEHGAIWTELTEM